MNRIKPCSLLLLCIILLASTTFVSCSYTTQTPKIDDVMKTIGTKRLKPTIVGRVQVRTENIEQFLKLFDIFIDKHKFEKRLYPDVSSLMAREVSFFSLWDKSLNTNIPAVVVIDFEERGLFKIEFYRQGFNNLESYEKCILDFEKVLDDNGLTFVRLDG